MLHHVIKHDLKDLTAALEKNYKQKKKKRLEARSTLVNQIRWTPSMSYWDALVCISCSLKRLPSHELPNKTQIKLAFLLITGPSCNECQSRI